MTEKVSIDVLRAQYGFNELPIPKENVLVAYVKNFWGPLAWLMEIIVIIGFFSGQKLEAIVIACLLIINSVINSVQHQSAAKALALLAKNLSTNAQVFRNNRWQSIPTRELLPGDIVHVQMGDIVPADIIITEGNVSINMANLTGESLPKEATVADTIFSGCIVERGKVTGQVAAIGKNTAYGKTATLLETSHPPTHMEKVIFAIIKYFFIINMVLAVMIVVFGLKVHIASIEIINFVIVLLLTSVPVSFPTMFAVAQSYGALELSKKEHGGVLVRRLAAIQECATVDIFCSDKTGTLTENNLKIQDIKSYGNYSKNDVVAFATACCDPADEGSIDHAILMYAKEQNVAIPQHDNFIPFDATTKRTEADVLTEKETVHLFMGLPELLLDSAVACHDSARIDVAAFSAQGLRVMAIVAEYGKEKACVGLVTFSDPIKPDAPLLIKELKDLGVRVVMITGDGRATAQTVAQQLGLQGEIITAEELKAHPEKALVTAVFAEAYPEDKLTIIRALQQAGHTVGMTGDGVNDAPALQQAEVGIAVCGATDVAKQSASFILTNLGLEGVIDAIKMSREVYSRLRSWALNKIVKSFEVAIFTTALFFITHSYILSPLLAVLLLLANDFVTISIATDRANYSSRPGKWNIGKFVLGAAIISCVPLVLLVITYKLGLISHYAMDGERTLIYLALILYGKSNLYAIRAWPHAWKTRPSATLVVATLFSILFALTISIFGFFITPIELGLVGIVILLAIVNFFAVDMLKSTRLVRKLIGV